MTIIRTMPEHYRALQDTLVKCLVDVLEDEGLYNEVTHMDGDDWHQTNVSVPQVGSFTTFMFGENSITIHEQGKSLQTLQYGELEDFTLSIIKGMLVVSLKEIDKWPVRVSIPTIKLQGLLTELTCAEEKVKRLRKTIGDL